MEKTNSWRELYRFAVHLFGAKVRREKKNDEKVLPWREKLRYGALGSLLNCCGEPMLPYAPNEREKK